MIKFFNNLLFLFKALFIVLLEYCFYLYYGNFDSFVNSLTNNLAYANILYVKIFQAVAFNNGFINEDLNNHLVKFTDNVPWEKTEIDLDTMLKLHDDYGIVLDKDIVPVNSGMISLVFHASMKEKETMKPVVIKMKRNNIHVKLEEAIEQLMFVVSILSFIPFITDYRIPEIIKTNISLVKQQLSFLDEVNNMLRIKDNCKNIEYIRIPYAEKEITVKYPNVIIMEKIDGLKISQIEEEDHEKYARLVVRFAAITTLIHGVTHGDLHPGNILFMKQEKNSGEKYQIGIIDFGIVYEIDSVFQEKMVDLYSELFTRTSKEVATNLLYSGCLEPMEVIQNLPKVHTDNLIMLMAEIIDEVMNKNTANQIEVCKVLMRMDRYMNNHQLTKLGIKPSNNFVKAQLALAMSQGVTLTLCKEKFISVVNTVINELFHTELLTLE